MAKMGRPTDCPKNYRVTARVDEETKKILDQYCEKHNINQAEGIRHAILRLKEDE